MTHVYRITFCITDDEARAIRKLADDEVRSVNDQVHYILRQELKRRGLLSDIEWVDADKASREARFPPPPPPETDKKA